MPGSSDILAEPGSTDRRPVPPSAELCLVAPPPLQALTLDARELRLRMLGSAAAAAQTCARTPHDSPTCESVPCTVRGRKPRTNLWLHLSAGVFTALPANVSTCDLVLDPLHSLASNLHPALWLGMLRPRELDMGTFRHPASFSSHPLQDRSPHDWRCKRLLICLGSSDRGLRRCRHSVQWPHTGRVSACLCRQTVQSAAETARCTSDCTGCTRVSCAKSGHNRAITSDC